MVQGARAEDAGADEVTDPNAMAPRRTLFVFCFTLAILAGLAPELTYRWYYDHPDVTRGIQVLGPMLFVPFTIATYYYSGRRKWTLWLWLLAPVCFLRIVLFIVTGILWSLRGGMV